MKKTVGVIPLYDDERKSYWMLPGYMEALQEQGLVPVMLPLTEDKEALDSLFELCDGYLFTGGHDVNPKLYGEKRESFCGDICTPRDVMEEYIFNKVVERDKPLLGICRGVQLVNVLCGGTLYQDLPSQINTLTNHHQEPPYDVPVHGVRLFGYLKEILGKDKIRVNSYHHQAVKALGKGLEIGAYSEDDLIEAVYMPDKAFIVAVQWHPEFSYKVDENAVKLFSAFAEAIRVSKK